MCKALGCLLFVYFHLLPSKVKHGNAVTTYCWTRTTVTTLDEELPV